MNWLIEIFTSNSDKARLVTTIVAAIIAVSVVILNQYFNSKRARKERLIEKLEEMYSVIIKMQTLKDSTHYEVMSKIHMNDERRQLFELHDELDTVGAGSLMLSGLYFNELRETLSKLHDEHINLREAFEISSSLSEYNKASKKTMDNLNTIYPQIYTELSGIMKKIMH